MKKTFKTVIQKKDWLLLAGLVVAIIALVMLITPQEKTIDTITVVPAPEDLVAVPSSGDTLESVAPALDLTNVPPENRVLMLAHPGEPAIETMAAYRVEVPIPDPMLKSKLNALLAAATGLTRASAAPIYEDEMSLFEISSVSGGTDNVMLVNLSGAAISDLTGLNKLVPPAGKLLAIDLSNNNISSLNPLAGMTSLAFLNVNSNRITDLTPLTGLVNLTDLYFSKNQVSDITPLAGMSRLTSLNAADNAITSVAPLQNHTFSYLYLDGNRLGSLVLNLYSASPTTAPYVMNIFEAQNNYINIWNPALFSPGLNSALEHSTVIPQYKMDMFQTDGSLVPMHLEISETQTFRLLRRITSDGIVFGQPELIPGAAISMAYEKDANGKDRPHVVDVSFDNMTGNITIKPVRYGTQRVSFYLFGVAGDFTTVTIEFKVPLAK